MKRFLFTLVAMLVLFVAVGSGKAAAADKFYGYVGGKAVVVTFSSSFFPYDEATRSTKGTIKFTASKATYTLKGSINGYDLNCAIYNSAGKKIGDWVATFGVAAHQAFLEGELIKVNGTRRDLGFTDQADRSYWVDYKNPAW